MLTAKLFTNGSSFAGSEIYAQTVILVPESEAWETFMEGVNGFTDDYFTALENRDNNDIPPKRETL